MRYALIGLFAALLLAVCIVDDILTNQVFKQMQTLTTEAINELEKEGDDIANEAKEKIEKINIYWTSKSRGMSIFIHHEETKFLGDHIALVKGFSEANLKDETMVELKALLYEVNSLNKQYAFNITNIL